MSDDRNPHELLSRGQIEAEYGLGKRWLTLAATRGDGPPMVRISAGMVRYRRSDVEEWIASRVVQSTTGEKKGRHGRKGGFTPSLVKGF
jgi:predicted DNA-binding transcriptional regulator AlpA